MKEKRRERTQKNTNKKPLREQQQHTPTSRRRYTHFGQLKGTIGKGKVKGVMIKGDPIFSLTANTDGLMVRFSNRGSTKNFHEGLEKHLDWADTTGLWVHVKIVTTFGESMEVRCGAVRCCAVTREKRCGAVR